MTYRLNDKLRSWWDKSDGAAIQDVSSSSARPACLMYIMHMCGSRMIVKHTISLNGQQ